MLLSSYNEIELLERRGEDILGEDTVRSRMIMAPIFTE
jgi:hypothetical protein